MKNLYLKLNKNKKNCLHFFKGLKIKAKAKKFNLRLQTDFIAKISACGYSIVFALFVGKCSSIWKIVL